jgi:hypothetical protein
MVRHAVLSAVGSGLDGGKDFLAKGKLAGDKASGDFTAMDIESLN